jgi:hypothetical protein
VNRDNLKKELLPGTIVRLSHQLCLDYKLNPMLGTIPVGTFGFVLEAKSPDKSYDLTTVVDCDLVKVYFQNDICSWIPAAQLIVV